MMIGSDSGTVTVVNPAETGTELGSDDMRTTQEERYESGEASEPEELAEAITFAVALDVSIAIELNLFRPGGLCDTFR